MRGFNLTGGETAKFFHRARWIFQDRQIKCAA
jgi:hypothetical protein